MLNNQDANNPNRTEVFRILKVLGLIRGCDFFYTCATVAESVISRPTIT